MNWFKTEFRDRFDRLRTDFQKEESKEMASLKAKMKWKVNSVKSEIVTDAEPRSYTVHVSQYGTKEIKTYHFIAINAQHAIAIVQNEKVENVSSISKIDING